MSTHVPEQAWADLARVLDVEPAALKAVAAVEAAGSGFVTIGDRVQPKNLFEGHAFHRLTGGRFARASAESQLREVGPNEDAGSRPVSGCVSTAACASIVPRRCSPRAGACSRSWVRLCILRLLRRGDVVAQQHAGADEQMDLLRALHRAAAVSGSAARQEWTSPPPRTTGRRTRRTATRKRLAAAYAQLAGSNARRGAWRASGERGGERRTRRLAAGPRGVRPVRAVQPAIGTSATCAPTPSIFATGNIGRTSPWRRPPCCGRNARAKRSSRARRTRARAARWPQCSSTCS